MSDLSPEMQSRLDAWRKQALEVGSAEKVRGRSRGNQRSPQWDYGDDIADYEKKEAEAWRRHLESFLYYRGTY
jgi:hypothetical protein